MLYHNEPIYIQRLSTETQAPETSDSTLTFCSSLTHANNQLGGGGGGFHTHLLTDTSTSHLNDVSEPESVDLKSPPRTCLQTFMVPRWFSSVLN